MPGDYMLGLERPGCSRTGEDCVHMFPHCHTCTVGKTPAVPQQFHMRIVFGIDISSPSLNKMTKQLLGGQIVMKDAMEVAIEQTVPFVPTDEVLAEYAEAIKYNCNTSGLFHMENVQFKRYDFIKPVDEKGGR